MKMPAVAVLYLTKVSDRFVDAGDFLAERARLFTQSVNRVYRLTLGLGRSTYYINFSLEPIGFVTQCGGALQNVHFRLDTDFSESADQFVDCCRKRLALPAELVKFGLDLCNTLVVKADDIPKHITALMPHVVGGVSLKVEE